MNAAVISSFDASPRYTTFADPVTAEVTARLCNYMFSSNNSRYNCSNPKNL